VYLKGIDNIEKVREPTDEINKLAIALYQNCSLASNKVGKSKVAVDLCTRVLSIDEKAVKALYIRSQASTSEKNL
jgi:hypothetical protein